MKNQIKIFTLLVSASMLVALLNPAQAQISGYQGKRFSIGYGGNIGYAMFNRNSSGSSLFATSETDFPEKLFSFNYKHQGQMELVLSNKQVLGFQGSYGKTQFKAFHSGDEYMSTTLYENYQYTQDIGDDIYTNMKFFTAGIYLKSFTSNTAPIGKYWAYKLSVLRYAADAAELKMPSDFPRLSIPADEYRTSFVFTISQGTSRIYFNRFIVDTNIEFGLPFVIPYFGFDVYNYDYNPSTYKEIFAKRMGNRLWGNFLFNVNVNVSLLAF